MLANKAPLNRAAATRPFIVSRYTFSGGLLAIVKQTHEIMSYNKHNRRLKIYIVMLKNIREKTEL